MIDDARGKSHQGVAISTEAASSFASIQEQIRQLDRLVAEIAASSNEQSKGIGEINTSVNQMDKVTQSTAATAEENAASATELNQHAVQLRDTVGRIFVFVGGRREQDPLGRSGAPRENGRRSSDQRHFARQAQPAAAPAPKAAALK